MAYGKRVVGWALVSLAYAGCGKSDGDVPEQRVSSTQELAAEMARLRCGSRVACCEDLGHEFDETRCIDDYEASLLDGAWSEGEDAGGSFDAVQASDCLAQYEARRTCGKIDDGGNVLEACDYVIHGDVAPGEPCESRLQCAVGRGQSASCGDDSVCVVFTLQQAKHGRDGDACRTSCERDECIVEAKPTPSQSGYEGADVGCYRSDGVYCGHNGVCQPLAELGENCSDSTACGEGAYCDDVNGTALCAEKLADGADCFTNPPACRSGYCAEETWLCGAAPALRAEECSDSM